LWRKTADMGLIGGQSLGFGNLDRDGKQLSAAMIDFREARRRAAVHAVLGRLHGTSLALLSYEDVADRLRITGQVERGVREIPLEKIVGSVGRYDEFDRSFLPLTNHDAQRWAGVRAAAADPTGLPPIDVYQIDDVYFVIDGNHRVSIARHMGLEFLAAHIIEIKTRVPFPDDMRHDELILASEQAAFLDHTRLDRLRPEAELATSLPGQYDKLENHIEVHRFFIEMKEEHTLSDEEAVSRWYDEAYLPVVEAIREHGLLRGFNHRTETDLYLWIAENQAALRNELGWEIGPQTAVENFSLPPQAGPQSRLGRFYSRVIHAVVPKRRLAQQTWSAHKTLDRYSDRLFAVILAITTAGDADTAVTQAVTVAQKEGAFLFVIQTEAAAEEEVEEGHMFSERAALDRALAEAGVAAELGFEQAGLSQIISRRLNLVDLLVLTTAILSNDQGEGGKAAILNKCARPVLIVPGATSAVERILLIYDDSPQAREALFAAAYMAEMWGCQVVVLAKADAAPGALNKAAPYLEMHETPPESILAGLVEPEAVFQTAAEQECDLIVMGGYREGPMSKTAVASWLVDAPENLKCLLFVCP
jgi:nucleotide-binding universal stress UspA family protein